MALSPSTRKTLLRMQKSEITEHCIYRSIAKRTKDPHNKEVIESIAKEEKDHYDTWAGYTGVRMRPNHLKVILFRLMNVLFGITFVLKYMERGEMFAQKTYRDIKEEVPEAERIEKEENEHEMALLGTLDENRVKYIRSTVLGLNDALVELTGALAGLTFALSDNTLISLSGLITGIAASLSMAASEYLSTKAEGRSDALRSSLYTGTAYVLVVALLIAPYLLLDNAFISLAIMLVTALLIILIFNFYMAVALDLNFKQRFLQMVTISMGVAGFSFLVGIALRSLFGIDI